MFKHRRPVRRIVAAATTGLVMTGAVTALQAGNVAASAGAAEPTTASAPVSCSIYGGAMWLPGFVPPGSTQAEFAATVHTSVAMPVDEVDHGGSFAPEVTASLELPEVVATGLRAQAVEISTAQTQQLVLAGETGPVSGGASGTMSQTDIPASGPATWSGTAVWDNVPSDIGGTHDMTLGYIGMTLRASRPGQAGTTYLMLECTPSSGQPLVMGTVTVAEPFAGAEFTCSSALFGNESYRGYLEADVDLPDVGITQGVVRSAAADLTWTWTRAATAAMRAADVTLLPDSTNMTVEWKAGDEHSGNSFNLSTAVPGTSYAQWGGSGQIGPLPTATIQPFGLETTAVSIAVGAMVGDAENAVDLPFECEMTDYSGWPEDEVTPAMWGSTQVVAAPSGVPFECRRPGDEVGYPVYVDIDAELPSAPVAFGSAVKPAVNASLRWSLESAAALRASGWTLSAGTSALRLAGSTGSVSGTVPLAFSAVGLPPAGVATWTAGGSWGSLPTTTAGELALGVSALEIELGQDATFTCSPEAALSLGTVTVAQKVDAIAVTKAAAISGAVRVGSKVTASATFSLGGTTLSYQWLRNKTAIKGATGATYVIAAADLGASLSVRVTASKAGSVSTASTSAAVKVQAGVLTTSGKPKVSGKFKVGKKLSAKAPAIAGTVVSYQWLRNGKAIKGATKATYKLPKATKKKKVSLRVTYKRAGYTTLTLTSKAKKVK